MKGLLLKDYYLSIKYYKPYFLILFVFAGISIWGGYNPFFISYPFMIISMMGPGMQNVDESCNWDVYCGTMPCSRKMLVCEKYIFGLIWAALGLVIVMASQVVRMLLNGGIVLSELGGVLTVCLFLIFFLPSISLPFVFKYGAEKGRIVQYLIIGVVCSGAAFLSLAENVGDADISEVGMGNLLAVLAALMLYVCSWFLSIRFYEKREIR